MTAVRFVILDVFTKERFKGNPLAIVEIPRGEGLSQENKQRIAREFNLSETVFLHPLHSGESESYRTYDIFTTTQELPFAGHPTIGTIVYLYQNSSSSKPVLNSITLQAKAGSVVARFHRDTGIAEASIPHNVRIHKTPTPLQGILNAQPSMQKLHTELGPSYPLVSIVKGMTFVLVKLPGVGDLAELGVGGPGIDREALTCDNGWESFIAHYFYAITSENEEEKRIYIQSRMIEPVCGEDPATGSAATALSAYLALQRGSASALYNFSIQQGVEMGRPSDIGVKVLLDNSGKSIQEVHLSGSGVIVAQGTLNI
ncbi:MAG: hypothetical protein Q9219_001471 [cf. Caloplaca sp. 3 TL-2023]